MSRITHHVQTHPIIATAVVSGVFALQAWTLVTVVQLAREVAVLHTQNQQILSQVSSLEVRNEHLNTLINNLRSSTIRTGPQPPRKK